MEKLYAPSSYYKLTQQEREAQCNGCGKSGFGGYITPDTIWGMSITDCCDIHDHSYATGSKIADKDKADRVFLNNMMRKIEAHSPWLAFVRRLRAKSYYKAVRYFGGSAFWDGK